MPSRTQEPIPGHARKASPDATPEHGRILDIGGSSLRGLYVDRLEDTLAAIADSTDTPTLPDELLYDDKGLLIWNQIISIPEFYQTHDEIALFDLNSSEIIDEVPRNVTMIDLGSGDTNKVDHLLATFESKKVPATYLALDISKTSLDQSIASLAANHSGPNAVVKCGGLWGTFENGLEHIGRLESPRLLLSLGSVLCNDPWPRALGNLRVWASTLQPDDRMLIGMDGHLVADQRDKIWAAYHSCDKLFRDFFLNGLKNANKLLGYNLFVEQDWDFMAELEEQPTTRHRFFLRAKKDIPLQEDGKIISKGEEDGKIISKGEEDEKIISKGQEIDWFDSHKYGEQDVRLMCSEAGLTVIKSWTAPDSDFRQYLVRATCGIDDAEDQDNNSFGGN